MGARISIAEIAVGLSLSAVAEEHTFGLMAYDSKDERSSHDRDA